MSDDKLDQIFEIIDDNTQKQPTRNRNVPKVYDNNAADVDFEYSRQQLYSVIERGQDAMENLLEIAQQSEHPRAFEVFGQLMDRITNANKELISLHKSQKDLKSNNGNVQQNVTNALFVGSTAELQKLLKNNSN